MQLDSQDETNNKRAVGRDGGGRRRFYSKQSLGVIRQRLDSLEDVPGMIKMDVPPPGTVRNANREVLPVHKVEIAKDPIGDAESRF